MSRQVTVYKSRKIAELYLYVDHAEGLARVPDELKARFGTPVEAMQLTLTPDRRLARADAATVLNAIEKVGFYLQVPPRPEAQDPPT